MEFAARVTDLAEMVLLAQDLSKEEVATALREVSLNFLMQAIREQREQRAKDPKS